MQDDINALGTNLLVISPGSSTSIGRRARRLRLRFDAHRARRRVVAFEVPPRPTSPAVAPVSTHDRFAGQRHRQLDDDHHRHDTVVGVRPVAEGRIGTVHHGTRTDGRPMPSWSSAPTPPSELFAGRDPVGETVSYNGVKLEVIGVLEPLSSSEQTSSNDLAVVPLRSVPAAPRRRDEPQLGQLDLREGRRPRRRCPAPTRKPPRSC